MILPMKPELRVIHAAAWPAQGQIRHFCPEIERRIEAGCGRVLEAGE
jgi:hypothetical protein